VITVTSSRRELLRQIGVATSGTVGLVATSSTATASSRSTPEHVTLSFDEATIAEYQPQLVLQSVEPRPLAFHALHAESSESSLNAVYGFTQYPYQEGVSEHDSHLGDHEPIIVWYDQSTGDVERVDYSAYHWFRGSLPADALAFADDGQQRPIMRVDPTYHHYYGYQGPIPGEQIQLRNLLDSIDSWLNNGLGESLALSQPYDPWEMLGRKSWWRHTTENRINAWIQSLWFNLGFADARETADVQEVETW
jgi:hypothetical protein